MVDVHIVAKSEEPPQCIVDELQLCGEGLGRVSCSRNVDDVYVPFSHLSWSWISQRSLHPSTPVWQFPDIRISTMYKSVVIYNGDSGRTESFTTGMNVASFTFHISTVVRASGRSVILIALS